MCLSLFHSAGCKQSVRADGLITTDVAPDLHSTPHTHQCRVLDGAINFEEFPAATETVGSTSVACPYLHQSRWKHVTFLPAMHIPRTVPPVPSRDRDKFTSNVHSSQASVSFHAMVVLQHSSSIQRISQSLRVFGVV